MPVAEYLHNTLGRTPPQNVMVTPPPEEVDIHIRRRIGFETPLTHSTPMPNQQHAVDYQIAMDHQLAWEIQDRQLSDCNVKPDSDPMNDSVDPELTQAANDIQRCMDRDALLRRRERDRALVFAQSYGQDSPTQAKMTMEKSMHHGGPGDGHHVPLHTGDSYTTNLGDVPAYTTEGIPARETVDYESTYPPFVYDPNRPYLYGDMSPPPVYSSRQGEREYGHGRPTPVHSASAGGHAAPRPVHTESAGGTRGSRQMPSVPPPVHSGGHTDPPPGYSSRVGGDIGDRKAHGAPPPVHTSGRPNPPPGFSSRVGGNIGGRKASGVPPPAQASGGGCHRTPESFLNQQSMIADQASLLPPQNDPAELSFKLDATQLAKLIPDRGSRINMASLAPIKYIEGQDWDLFASQFQLEMESCKIPKASQILYLRRALPENTLHLFSTVSMNVDDALAKLRSLYHRDQSYHELHIDFSAIRQMENETFPHLISRLEQAVEKMDMARQSTLCSSEKENMILEQFQTAIRDTRVKGHLIGETFFSIKTLLEKCTKVQRYYNSEPGAKQIRKVGDITPVVQPHPYAIDPWVEASPVMQPDSAATAPKAVEPTTAVQPPTPAVRWTAGASPAMQPQSANEMADIRAELKQLRLEKEKLLDRVQHIEKRNKKFHKKQGGVYSPPKGNNSYQGRGQPNSGYHGRRGSDSQNRRHSGCFWCGDEGHWKRDCPRFIAGQPKIYYGQQEKGPSEGLNFQNQGLQGQ